VEPAEFQTIVNIAFLASLRAEEGRPVSFTAMLIDESELNALHSGSYSEHQNVLTFSTPIPFTPTRVAKLAAAFNPYSTALMVRRSRQGEVGGHEIWGGLFFGDARAGLFDTPVMAGAGFSATRPNCLTVTARSVGALLLSRSAFVIAHLDTDGIVKPTDSPLFDRGALRNVVDAALGSTTPPTTPNGHNYNIESVQFLLSEVARQDTGATIVLAPHNPDQRLMDVVYGVQGDLGIAFLLGRVVSDAQRPPTRATHPIHRVLAHRLSAVARLAAIDGALVLSAGWHLVGAGVKLRATHWTGNFQAGPQSLTQATAAQALDRSKLGTRHNSAIDFVGACPGAVVSEDGPIRGLAHGDSSTVLYWPDCRQSGWTSHVL
jgi:hypothetical protein